MEKMRQTQKFKMDFVQKVTLSPIEKYVMYNRFPWKLVVHILLLVFTTYQALSMVASRTAFTRSEHMVLKYVLLASSDDSDRINYFNLQDFSAQLTTMVDNLNSLDEQLIQNVSTQFAEYDMYIYYRELNNENINKTYYALDLSEGLIEPFNATDIQSIKTFLSDVALFEIRGVGILNYVEYPDLLAPQSCTNWTFAIKYNFQTFANIEVFLETGNSNCHEENHDFGQDFLFVHLIVILLASIGLALSWKHIYHTGAEYMHQRQVYRQVRDIVNQPEGLNSQQRIRSQISIETPNNGAQQSPDMVAYQHGLDFQQTWQQLGFIESLPLLDVWFIVSVLGNFIQIVGSLIAVIDCLANVDLSVFRFQEALIGFGCMVAWLMMLKYLEYNPNINLMTSTLRLASSNILMFMIGVLPFFFGFVFLGQCIFWRFERFSTTLNSILTLFALANGDIVSDTFMDTWSVGILGQIFLVIFMILFFTAVQNVFITIIMEGFEQNRKEKQQQSKQAQPPQAARFGEQSKVEMQTIRENEISENEQNKSPQSVKPTLQLEFGEHQDDKEMVIGKLRLNTKRVERMLDELEELLAEIERSRLKPEEKAYLLSVYRESVENVNRNIKFQLSNIAS